MSLTARKHLLGLLLVLGIGLLLGWLYSKPLLGLLIATGIALAWQVRQLLAFDRALRTGDFEQFRYGDGIWEQMFSRYRYERLRAANRKASYRSLLKEIRKSTDAMPDGAVILDSNNEIVNCNRAAKALTGLKRRKDKGQRIDNILRDPKIARLLHHVDSTASVEIPSPVEDGNWLHCRIVPYGAEQKLLLLRDVTDRIRLTRMRRDFVANASHELRSPLTVINGYLDALGDDEKLPAHWHKPVGQMQSQARRMNQILGEMLELSRLESAGIGSHQQEIDVAQLLRRVRDDLSASAKGVNIVVDSQSTAKLLGVGSEIESVVVNLLSNAVRYTPAGGEISMTWSSDTGGADLIVTDTGEGIDDQHIPRLTERFFRVDRGRSRNDGGVGLGLAIVKHVLARHDAVLSIKSEPGTGSEFVCHFPEERVLVSAPALLS